MLWVRNLSRTKQGWFDSAPQCPESQLGRFTWLGAPSLHVSCLGYSDSKSRLPVLTWASHCMATGLLRRVTPELPFQENKAKTAWSVMSYPWVHVVSPSLAKRVTRLPDSRGKDVDSMSWWEECQHICGHFSKTTIDIYQVFALWQPQELEQQRRKTKSTILGIRRALCPVFPITHCLRNKFPFSFSKIETVMLGWTI